MPLNRSAMFLSKTDFKVACTCATKLYYKKLKYPSMLAENEYLQFLADGGYMVETIAKLCREAVSRSDLKTVQKVLPRGLLLH